MAAAPEGVAAVVEEGERLVLSSGLPAVVIRPSHVYGPGGWYVEGTLAAPSCPGGLTALRSGQFALVQPDSNWRDLLVGGMRLSVARPKTPAGCPLS